MVLYYFLPCIPLPGIPCNQGNQRYNNIIELNGQEVSTFLTYKRNMDIFGNAGIPG